MSENTNNLKYEDSKFSIENAILDKVEGAIDSSTGEKTITLDSNLKVLGSLDISGATYSLCQSPEWIKVLVDSQERIIAGVRTDGSVYINKIEGVTDAIQEIREALGVLEEKNSRLEERVEALENPSETEVAKQYIDSYASNLNNSIGENCFANGTRTNLKILAYGNSFMRNSIAYLSQIAKNGCNVNLIVGNLYTGGTELQNHYSALLNNSSDYEWHKYVNGEETQTQNHQTPMRGLLEERWDAIIVHQYIPWEYPFEPTLNKFLKLIIERIGYTPKFYINATWAGSLDENETYYGFETEQEMWEAMLTYVKQSCEDAGIQEYSIIPTGTAIQNARTLSWADDYNRFVNTSPDLHHLNPAGGFIAACTVFQKIVTPLNGIPCSNTTFRITSATAMPPSSSVQEGILVTDDNYLSLCNAAIQAVDNPFEITNII